MMGTIFVDGGMDNATLIKMLITAITVLSGAIAALWLYGKHRQAKLEDEIARLNEKIIKIYEEQNARLQRAKEEMRRDQ